MKKKETTAKKATPKKTAKPTAKKSPVSKPQVAKKSAENLSRKKTSSVFENPENQASNSTSSGMPPGASSSTKTHKSFNFWPILTFVLLIAFIGIIAYQYSMPFRAQVDSILSRKTTPAASEVVAQKDTFVIPFTVVYNPQDAQQKPVIEKYLQNVENNLENTKTTVNWLSSADQQGKDLLEKSGRKYLPLFITDESIKQHPQFASFALALDQKNGMYVFKSEGMQYLEAPAVGDARFIGADPAKAEVVIVEYQSMTCHFCQQMHPIFEELVKKYPKQVSVVDKHFDRGGPDQLLGAAIECAGDQGKFNEMMTAVYADQQNLFAALQKDPDPNKAAKQFVDEKVKSLKLSASKFDACINTGNYQTKVQNHTQEAQEFGIQGTPSFFVNKQFVGGAIDKDALETLVQAELKK